MGRGKSPKNPSAREQNELRKYKQQVKLLKRQLSRYKKLLNRIDYEQFVNLSEAVSAQHKEETTLKKELKQIDYAERWKCFECEDDWLRLVIFYRVNEPRYFRKCPSCGNKTKTQKLTDDVAQEREDEQRREDKPVD